MQRTAPEVKMNAVWQCNTQRASQSFDVESTSKFRRQFFNAFSTFFRHQIKKRQHIDVD